jgi:hypothetical protein
MSLQIALDSTDRQNPLEPSNNFTTRFNPPIFLNNKPGYSWVVALVKCNCWYSFYNIKGTTYNNNTLRYRISGVAPWQTITIPNGIYNITQLNNVIQGLIIANGDVGANVSIVPNFSELKISMVVVAPYQVDLSIGDFYRLLGFTAAQAAVPITAPVQGLNVGDITNGLDNLYITTNIVQQSWYKSNQGSVLYSFVPNSPPGSNISVIPSQLIYIPVKTDNGLVSNINMRIIDNRNRDVDFENQEFQYLLHFKQIEV